MDQISVSKRVGLTLPDGVFEELVEWADQQGRPAANLAAFLVETAIREAKESGEYTPAQKTAKKSK